jgi:hypothetical protein
MSAYFLVLFLANLHQTKLTEPKLTLTEVTPDLICKVQHAIRFREKAWSQDLCQKIASAFNKEGKFPGVKNLSVVGAAIAANESDFREKVSSISFKRTILLKKKKIPKEVTVVDVGLMGIRCLKGSDGRCTNGLARGLTLTQLLDPVKNIEIGMKILKAKYKAHGKNWLTRYNGGNGEYGYSGRIHAILLAFEGKQGKVSKGRMTKMTGQIIEAVKPKGIALD